MLKMSALLKLLITALSFTQLLSCGKAEPPQQAMSFEESFQTLLINAQPGDVIEVPAGIHDFSRSLSLTVPGVTIRGAGIDSSILSFKNQAQGAEGLLVSADNFTIEDLAIEDTIGDALKINESTNVAIRRVRTEWTNGPDTGNGAYGIYPVQSTNVLIDGAVAIGARDAGIYVGQSSQIIVRNSRAEYNVAGIEIENSVYADVYDNIATNNTGGILVFDLPNLPVQGGQATRVFNNRIFANNTENFAPEGAIVGNVPPGTGLLVLANDNIEVFDNQFADNGNVHVMVYSYTFGGRSISDADYDPFPEQIFIHDNAFSGGGSAPRHQALIALKQITGEDIPNVVWDGVLREDMVADNVVCLGATEQTSFVNLNGSIDASSATSDNTAHLCSLPRLPAISFALASEP